MPENLVLHRCHLRGFVFSALHCPGPATLLPGREEGRSPAPLLTPAEPLALQARRAALPTIWIAGDSNAGKGPPTATGWGMPFSKLLNSQ